MLCKCIIYNLSLQEKDQFWQMGSKILNKPKPKVEPPLPEGVSAGDGAAKTEKKEESSDKDQTSESKPAEKVPEMDVD